MCGIAGFLNLACNQEHADHLISAMCSVIRHRGPDEQGTWTGRDENGCVALGMRRLSIIDLAGGQQPIFNEDKSILIVFNGEIYNYQSLQQELRTRGHHFRTSSDTETILHAYEEYGDDCVKHLRGMFAFAIWDQKRQRLLAARDRFGKKPFNYYWDGQRLIFGSEIKSLLETDIPRVIDPIALDEFLVYHYVPTPLTLFQNIKKLPAAHRLIYENGQIRTERYWDISFQSTCQDDEATAIERITGALDEAIRIRLMSEVPLGAFLSGGIDSSMVVALMSKMVSQPVKTFSIGFEEDEFNELPYARMVAQRFGTDHHEFFVRYDLVSVLPHLVWGYDEPFADASMLPTYYVSKLAREHVTVALSGDGGDEIFGGYEQYQREYHLHRIPAPLRQIMGHASQLIPDGIRGKKRLRTWLRDYGTRNIEANMLFPDHPRETMYSSDFFAQIRQHQPYERHLEISRQVEHLNATARMQYLDTRTYLADDILVKVDKASMLNSLETRAPLLDHPLAEYVASLPPTLRYAGGTSKYLLKKVARGILPDQILDRQKKGFATPLSRWFRNDGASYAHETLSSTRAQNRGIFHPEFYQKLLRTDGVTRFENHSQALWALLCLELWFQAYLDDESTVQTVGKNIPTLKS